MTPNSHLHEELASLLERLVEQLAHRIVALQQTQRASDTTSEQSSPWLNLANAASYLDWPKQRLYKLVASSGIPYYKQEGRLLFRRDELDNWLAACAQGERPMPGPGSELC